jgi:DNA ligase D-like protein (predicted polymerase)
MPAIAAASDRVWHSDRGRSDPGGLAGANPSPMPASIALAQARTARAVPEGDQWLHEIAIEGERVLARVEAGRVQLLGAEGSDRTAALAALVPAIQTLPVGEALLDCMATALDPDGQSSRARPPDSLYAIDLLYLDGYALTHVALGERKKLLAALVAQSQPVRDGLGRLHFADYVSGRGRETYAQACSLGAPGIVSKRIDSRYPPAASAWRRVPCPTSDKPRRSPQTQQPKHGREVRVATVKLTHPDRVLYPAVGITKLALARFYERVSERMLPYLEDRPLTLIRGPDGMAGQRFYVRHTGDWTPSELRQIRIEEGTGSGTAMLVDDVRGLLALAQMNVLEIHPWNARTRALEKPDRIVFDLDPGPEVAWGDVLQAARHVRDVLGTLDFTSFVKTTGGKGLHVVVPLLASASWDDTLEFSRLIAQGLARFEPARFSAGLAKAPRTSKIFVDYLRNRRGATAVSAYSSRAQPTATVSVPVAWDALDAVSRPDAFHISDVDAWYGPTDPWADYGKTRQRLTATKLKAARAALARALG